MSGESDGHDPGLVALADERDAPGVEVHLVDVQHGNLVAAQPRVTQGGQDGVAHSTALSRLITFPGHHQVGFGVGVDLRAQFGGTRDLDLGRRIGVDEVLGAQVLIERAQREKSRGAGGEGDAPAGLGQQERRDVDPLDLGQRGVGVVLRQPATKGPEVLDVSCDRGGRAVLV